MSFPAPKIHECQPEATFWTLRGGSRKQGTAQTRHPHQTAAQAVSDSRIPVAKTRPTGDAQRSGATSLARHAREFRPEPEYRGERSGARAGRYLAECALHRNADGTRISFHGAGGRGGRRGCACGGWHLTGSLDFRQRRGWHWRPAQLSLGAGYFCHKLTEEDLHKGVAHFNAALAQNPNCAFAFAGLADAYCLSALLNMAPPGEIHPRAKEMALSALRARQDLGDAHASLASVKRLFEWDWAGAEAEYLTALVLSSNAAMIHQAYGAHLAATGKADEALRE